MTVSLGLEELEQATAADPHNAELRYLLGAELAHRKDYDRAVIEIGNALNLAPEMHYARFQLGLLHLTMAHPVAATGVWAPLEHLTGQESPLRLFKQGLEALIEDRFDACVDLLTAGIKLNHQNPPLNADMTLILNQVKASQLKGAIPLDAHVSTPASPAIQDAAEAMNKTDVWTDFSKYGDPDTTRH